MSEESHQVLPLILKSIKDDQATSLKNKRLLNSIFLSSKLVLIIEFTALCQPILNGHAF